MKIDFGVLQMRLIAVAIRDRLVELRAIWSRIDLRQKIALLDRLPLDEIDLDDLAGDLAANDHVIEWNDGADAAQVDWNVMFRHRGGDDAYEWRCWLRRRRMPHRRPCEGERAAGRDREHRDHE